MADPNLQYVDDQTLFNLIDIEQKNFAFILQQIRMYGAGEVPLSKHNEFKNIEQRLGELRAECERRGLDWPHPQQSTTTLSATASTSAPPASKIFNFHGTIGTMSVIDTNNGVINMDSSPQTDANTRTSDAGATDDQQS